VPFWSPTFRVIPNRLVVDEDEVEDDEEDEDAEDDADEEQPATARPTMAIAVALISAGLWIIYALNLDS
jgi:hypothetical protein